MAKILLDYVFPIKLIVPTAQASTAFLKQVCLVVKPKAPVLPGKVFVVTNKNQIKDYTDNVEGEQFFDAGMSRIYLLTANDLNISAFLEENPGQFYTLVVSSDFNDLDISGDIITPGVKASAKIGDITFIAKSLGVAGNNIKISIVGTATAGDEVVTQLGDEIEVSIEDGVSTAQQIKDALEAYSGILVEAIIDAGKESDPQAVSVAQTSLTGGQDEIVTPGTGLTLGTFPGVTGVSSSNINFLKKQAVINNRISFYRNDINGAKNLAFAVGKLLSSNRWSNQQYVEMPFSDSIQDLGLANLLFDERISFVINDDEFSNRLGFFVCGRKAVIAPYIIKELCINLQSKALQWINANEPDYTLKEATLLEERLQEDVIDKMISNGQINGGTIEIKLEQENFVASGYITVPEPKALWRVVSEMRQTV